MESATKPNPRGRILVVEDERFYQELCREVLEEEGYEVDSTFTGEEALAKLKDHPYHILLIDLILPGIDGQEVLSRAKQIRTNMDIIMMTGYASVESAVKALKSGASDYLTKPVNPEELKLAVKRCIEFRGLFEENTELKGLVKLYQTVQLVSNTIELDKLHDLSLDVIMQGVSADSGVGLFFDAESKSLVLKSFRGMEGEAARSLAQHLIETGLKELPREIQLDPDFKPPQGLGRELGKSAIFVPLRCHDHAQKREDAACDGIIAAFRDREYGKSEVANGRFIAEQVSLSLENAMSFDGAQKMIFIDDLTGLFNMRYLDISLDNEIKRAKRYKTSLSLLFMDLDYFKEINDSYGHLVGSRLLRETAKVLNKCIREVDIGIRYGGDEFIVILTETGREGAMKVAERLRKRIEEHKFLAREGINTNLTCCVGVASYPEDAQGKTDLIHLADKAMYRGKETTRNCVYSAAAL